METPHGFPWCKTRLAVILFLSCEPKFYYAHTNRLLIESICFSFLWKNLWKVIWYVLCYLLCHLTENPSGWSSNFVFIFMLHAWALFTIFVSAMIQEVKIVMSENTFGALLQESVVRFTVWCCPPFSSLSIMKLLWSCPRTHRNGLST